MIVRSVLHFFSRKTVSKKIRLSDWLAGKVMDAIWLVRADGYCKTMPIRPTFTTSWILVYNSDIEKKKDQTKKEDILLLINIKQIIYLFMRRRKNTLLLLKFF